MKVYFFLAASATILLTTLNIFTNDSIVRVAVFCSADDKVSESFKILAHNLGKQLAKHNFGLITGGSRTGLMKEVVDGYTSGATSLENLYGVMPQVLAEYNVHHPAIPQENLHWVKTLHIRLAKYHDLADIIIILPGGFGTLHELMDFLVHNQFALNVKPIILINSQGYWDNLLAQFQTMIKHKLLSPKHLTALSLVKSDDECIEKLINQEFLYSEKDGLSSYYWEK